MVTFIDCFSAETVKSYFSSQECRLQEAGSWCQVCNSSQLHNPASPPAVCVSTGLLRIELQVGEFFYPVITLSWQLRNKERRKQRLKNEMRYVIQTRLKAFLLHAGKGLCSITNSASIKNTILIHISLKYWARQKKYLCWPNSTFLGPLSILWIQPLFYKWGNWCQ